MSNSNHYIIDTPLPLNRDFNGLKNEGLAFIQEHIGHEWTNLNPSDPGITILEQLCYALTELGYCNDFEIQDILTNEKGELDIKDQFYLPEEILTTSPVTINDYRKYLIDGVTGIDNAVINRKENTVIPGCHLYQTFLLISPAYAASIAVVCQSALNYLNKSRNIGDFFAQPQALTTSAFLLTGSIEISKQADPQFVLQQVQDNINHYIFPRVTAQGYYSSTAFNIPTETMFNGPLLKNGFILSESLGAKKDMLRAIDMVGLIRQVPGVLSVDDIGFYEETGTVSQIHCDSSAVLSPDITTSVNRSLFTVTINGNPIPVTAAFNTKSSIPHGAADEVSFVYGNKPGVNTKLKAGTFRDISSYYSVQNTFPAVFAVGSQGPPPDASGYQLAQSRQLKGYLTLMDQLLANQFSQLANTGKLFSFKNGLTGAPATLHKFMQLQDPHERETYEYAMPFRNFSPVYFYQPLYDIPHIRPLLKDNRTYNFTYIPDISDTANDKSWQEYKQDPYNAYVYGLMQLTENDERNLERRNDILDHLLARHGESPVLIDAYISGTVYSGTALQDKVIVKSLYLQNYATLSYNRMKAYNYQGAKKTGPAAWVDNANSQDEKAMLQQILKEIAAMDSTDSVIDSGKINRSEKISETDLINFSSVELKLALLFGLKNLYCNFIIANIEKINKKEAACCWWLISKRRGCIMIEMSLVLQTPGYDVNDVQTKEESPAVSSMNGDIVFIFPGYMPTFKTPEFAERLNLFLQHELPVTVSFAVYIIDDQQVLEMVADAFICWHDAVRFTEDTQVNARQQYGTALLTALKNASPFLQS